MKTNTFYLKDKYYCVIFLAPAVIALLILTIYPIVFAVRSSFFGWDLMKPGSQNIFVGLKNYIDVFKAHDFWRSLWITCEFSFFSVLFTMVVGSLMAFLMIRNLFGNLIVRTFSIAAMVITPVIVGTAWKLMYNPDWGLVSYLLSIVGISHQSFLSSESTVLPAVIFVDVWQWSPLVMVIILAALQGLPMDPYESAKVDGASSFQSFIHITLPLLKPSLLLALLIRTMDSLRTFDVIFSMTMGGPGTSTQNLNLLMYNTGFEFFQISKSATMAIILLVVITLASNFILKVFNGEELYA